MEQIGISVIMPVYNAGIYLEECLESLFAQTFQNFELICVNDASKDDLTLQILGNYQNRYSNMKVLHLEQNVGAGEARNLGFKEAVGEYIFFLDSDDVYAKELLERMYHEGIKADADVCMCGFIGFDSRDEKREPIYEWKPEISKLENKKKETYFLSWFMGPINKLCKRSFLIEHNIYFQSLSSQNDIFFSLMIAKAAKRKGYITETNLLKYRINIPTQITANEDPRNLVYAVNLMEETMKQNNLYDELLKKQLILYLIFRALDKMTKCRDDNINKECYFLIRDHIQRNQVADNQKAIYELCRKVMEQPYESRWFEDEIIDHIEELHLYRNELLNCIKNKQQIFLWGLGKRGDAFQRFCIEEGIIISGVTDKHNLNIGDSTIYGNRIFSTEEVMDREGISIIASNEDIYKELENKQVEADIISLEEYCPI